MTDKHIVVVGAGLMGTGITHAFLASGHHVTLVDTNANALNQARQSIAKILATACGSARRLRPKWQMRWLE